MNTEKLHLLCPHCRYRYLDYEIDEKPAILHLKKELGNDFSRVVKQYLDIGLRSEHNLFLWDDLATMMAKNGDLAGSRKMLEIMQSYCKTGYDYAFLAIRINEILADKEWCKRLYEFGKKATKTHNCHYNMLNFIEIGVLDERQSINLAREALTYSEYDPHFYYEMGLEVYRLDGIVDFLGLYSIAKSYILKALKLSKYCPVYFLENIKDIIEQETALYFAHIWLDKTKAFKDILELAKFSQKGENLRALATKKLMQIANYPSEFSETAQFIYECFGKEVTREFLLDGLRKFKDSEIILYALCEYCGEFEMVRENLEQKKGFNELTAKILIKYFGECELVKGKLQIWINEAKNIEDLSHRTNVAMGLMGYSEWMKEPYKRFKKQCKDALDFIELADCLVEEFFDYETADELYLKAVKLIKRSDDWDFTLRQIYKNVTDEQILRLACEKALGFNCSLVRVAEYFRYLGDIDKAKECIKKELKKCQNYDNRLYVARLVHDILKDDECALEIALKFDE
ncbi:hypothetical protein CCAL13119_03955 [Campylobacter sp. RM13119]|uniref:hypothetical protein n=1 Tax=Campylobacter californiensis TaxID=1032243 RepID=UPI001476681C|nr:hypothetical protein [Campylobacter sp. RM13119]MBE3606117.1 hypothetical protein [Campylobacter sp. RM13119]